MGKYSGIPGEYNFRLKVNARKAFRAAKDKGYKARLTGSRGYWTVTIKRKK